MERAHSHTASLDLLGKLPRKHHIGKLASKVRQLRIVPVRIHVYRGRDRKGNEEKKGEGRRERLKIYSYFIGVGTGGGTGGHGPPPHNHLTDWWPGIGVIT